MVLVATTHPGRPLPVVSRKKGPQFTVEVSQATNDYVAELRAPGILTQHEAWKHHMSGSREISGKGPTPEAAMEALIARLQVLVAEELLLVQWTVQLKEALRKHFPKGLEDNYPYFQWRRGGTWSVVWAQRSTKEPSGRRFSSASGASPLEAVTNALAGRRDCRLVNDSVNPCRYAHGHKGECQPLDPSLAFFRTA